MNARSYKIILLLLSSCVLIILGLQGFWIRSLYLQKKEAFTRNVYAALEQAAGMLQDRRNLRAIKSSYVVNAGSKTTAMRKKNRTGNPVHLAGRNMLLKAQHTISVKSETGVESQKDCVVIAKNNAQINIILNDGSTRTIVESQTMHPQPASGKSASGDEISELLEKMMLEITEMNAAPENKDTLGALIRKALHNKGIFLPFEFSVKKPPMAKDTTPLRSEGFSEELPFYRSDLSAGKVISTRESLLLQFPGQGEHVMAGMRGSLALSLVFSLVIMGVFYYVIRLISRQKKLSEIKNDFVNNMTHELRTPIATISLALDALRNPLVKDNTSMREEYHAILREENQKLGHHVEQVLQIALLDRNELRMDKIHVDIAELLRHTRDSFRLRLAEKKAELSLDAPGKAMMKGDVRHLKSVFANLLDNALKYSGEYCKVEIRLLSRPGEIFIHIRDNGIGIDESEQERIFEKFYRVPSGNLHDVKGFGLGLSYVRSVVVAHGGAITLQSTRNRGSEFTIRFNTENS